MESQKHIKLAVLDDYVSSSNQFFDPLKISQLLDDITYFPNTLDVRTLEGLQEQIERLQPYQVISSTRERTFFPENLLNALPNLKLLMNCSTRNRSIDFATAERHGITVTGTDGSYAHNHAPSGFDNTTQHTWSLILALTSRIAEDSAILRREEFYWQSGYMVSLAGKTMGIVGLGKLGSRTARTAILGFGMRVIAWSENITQEKADALATSFGLAVGQFKVVTKDELFRTSDVVSLHLVMSERTRNTVGQRELDLMKPSAFLVNTARAGLIDEEALWDALTNGKIAGAALDVFWTEPLEPKSKWRRPHFFGIDGRSRLMLSPHMGYVEADMLKSWYREQSEILQAWLEGENLTSYQMKSN